MARTRSIARDRYERVLARFESQAAADAQGLVEFGLDTGDYVRSVLHRALGQDKARLLLDRIVGAAPAPGFDSLQWMDPVAVADLLRQEHPQIVAVILVHLAPDQASAVLQHFPPMLRNDVMIRLATLDDVQPVALQELGAVLTRVLAGGESGSRPARGGFRTATEVLDLMDTGAETAVLDYIRSADADLARRLSDHLPAQVGQVALKEPTG
jgi:flagellar motor switch protein FliG